jgi:chloride channel 3/4/5
VSYSVLYLALKTNRDVPVIKLEDDNTVKSVRDQLIALMDAGYDDGVVPVLHKVEDTNDYRLTGIIGASELEHALSKSLYLLEQDISLISVVIGIVADEADSPVHFNTEKGHAYGESSVSSLLETSSHVGVDPFDFSLYLNQVGLT